MTKTMVCRVTVGELNKDDAIALEMALDDLRVYWEKTFGAGSFLLKDDAPERRAGLELLIGTAESLPRIAALIGRRTIENLDVPEQGFALDIVKKGAKRIAVLRAADRLGLQYAVYAFAEQFLGVRFVHPLLDLQPEKPPMPAEFRRVESPSRPLRTLYETSHVLQHPDREAQYSDTISWRWEDWAGRPERMRRFLAWGVKNRANIVVFDDTIFYCGKTQLTPFIVSDAVWACMDARGLKTIMWCGPGYTWFIPEGAYSKDDLCNHTAPRVGPWDKHLCIGKPAFWKDADDFLDKLAPYAHRLAGLWTNWQENVCGEGVIEGHEDGVTHNDSGGQYDMNSAHYRKPVLSKGGGCTACGQMENVDKWVKHMEYVNVGTAARGLPPAGITRAFWGMADPDDGMVAERVVPHLPRNSLSNVSCTPSNHPTESIEAWPRIMDEVNRADGGNRRILIYREMSYACGSDIPLVSFTSLQRIDDDHRVFGKYQSFAGVCGGVFVCHSMGWLMTLCSMRKQWQAGPDWKSWFRDYFDGLLGGEFVKTFLDIAATLHDVERLEGLTTGEDSAGYYSRWGLIPGRLAPETLPADGPLRVDDYNLEVFARLVKPGAADPGGIYTSERCAPALKRILSMRDKIEHVLDRLPKLADALPAGLDGLLWNDLMLQPLRVTARFLQSRLLMAQSCFTYIRMRERVRQGLDASAEAAEGEALCRHAFVAQDEYIRLRPRFCVHYPKEIKTDTLRTLIGWWQRLAGEPQLCRDLDICAFLDHAEMKDAQIQGVETKLSGKVNR
jgi:hypothetical protein